jgi:AcrR family transcriptional regulator
MSQLRRIPTQARSKKRLEAILAAGGEVFAEVGFDAATMERVAERAETSIGSVYQFFPNKLALFRAIAADCLERSRAAFAEVMGPDPVARPVDELITTIVDRFAALEAEDPSFRALWMNPQLYGEYAEADEALVQDFVEAGATLLAVKAPKLPAERRRIVVGLLIQVVVGMLYVSRTRDPVVADALREETKQMILRYLAPYL